MAGLIGLNVLIATAVISSMLLGDRPVPQADAVAEDGRGDDDCVLSVSAAPGIAPLLTEFAAGFDAPDGCTVAVTAAQPAEVARSLADGWDVAQDGPRPDVWVPDSTVWVRYVEASEAGRGLIPPEQPSIARTPTIAAQPMPMAEALGWPGTQTGMSDILPLLTDERDIWSELGHPEWGPFRFGVPDPTYSTAGLHGLLAFGAASSGVWTDSLSSEGLSDPDVRRLILVVERGIARSDRTVDEQLAALREADGRGEALTFLSGMVLSERDVWRYNQGLVGEEAQSPPQVPLAAIYPREGGLVFDHPYVQLRPIEDTTASEGVLRTAAAFLDHLTAAGTQEALQAQGFRNRDNVPGPTLWNTEGLQPDRLGATVPAPQGDAVHAGVDSWRRLGQRGTTLAVIDVSGSMGVRVDGTDTTLLDLTVQAASQGVMLFGRDSRFGLWEFSTDLPGGEQDGDYRELVPIGPMNEDLDGVSRREASLAALQGLQLTNDTALYDTTLAAYREVQANHDGGPINLVALFTDGKSDGDDLTREELLAELEAAKDPERPVQVLAIGWGPDADVGALEAIVGVTGGAVFTPSSPEEIGDVFLQVLTGG